MKHEALKEALSLCKKEQQLNAEIEAARLEEVVSACPKIGELIKERRNAILDGLRNALDGLSPVNLEESTRLRNAQIRSLLRQSGFDEDYLEPLYTCPLCRDSGFVGEHKKHFCSCITARCRQIESRSLVMQDSDETFEAFDETVFSSDPMPGTQVSQRDYTRILRQKCEQYANALPASPTLNLLFYGKSGLGKTYLLRSIAARASSREIGTLCLTANALLSALRKAYFSNHESENQTEIFYEVDLLLIDDLGTEPMLENITVEQLFALFDARIRHKKNTVISTNLTLTELQARYTERIASRLTDSQTCMTLKFLGDDIRKRRS